MSKHTPGPWKVATDYARAQSGAADIVPWSDQGRILARVVTTKMYQPEETLSNARLIAAAPDLLTACREFVRFAELPNVVDRGDYIRYQAKAIGAARAAIAKAEGK